MYDDAEIVFAPGMDENPITMYCKMCVIRLEANNSGVRYVHGGCDIDKRWHSI